MSRGTESIRGVLGKRILFFRTQRNLTQTELARRVGRSQAHISQIEKGTSEILADDLPRWCTALQVSLDDLLPEVRNFQIPGVQWAELEVDWDLQRLWHGLAKDDQAVIWPLLLLLAHRAAPHAVTWPCQCPTPSTAADSG